MKPSDIKEIESVFARTTESIVSPEEWKELLSSGKQLRIKYGVDVTAPFLHTGHAVNLWMMRTLQDKGHKVVFLIGDFTTQIGDPTGKNKTRPIIPKEEIEKNTALFIEQVKMVLRFDDPNLIEIRKNSEWFDTMSVADFLKLLSLITHGKMISRDMFQKRIEDGAEIYMHELIYPVLQGYDSYMLQADLTIIGSDQLFNEMLGRFYQEKFDQKPQVIITTKITPGIDGKAKQSKSLDNYIGLGHSPRDKFGRVMTLPDSLIMEYFTIYTRVSDSELAQMKELVATQPFAAKKALAQEIVKLYHGADVAQAELSWFEETFSKKTVPTDIPEITIASSPIVALDLLKHFYKDEKSNTELRRLFTEGAVSQGDTKLTDVTAKIDVATGDVIQVGKRTWFKIKVG